MSENGISPIEAGLRIERLPFDLQTADELYMIVFSWMSSRYKIEPASEQIEHVGAFFISSFSNAKRHADEMLACFKNNDDNLQFTNPEHRSQNLNSRLKISGIKTWCSERELILSEPFPQELADTIKALFYCDSDEDEFNAWEGINTFKENLETKIEDMDAPAYQFEEKKPQSLVAIEQQTALLEKYLYIRTQVSLPSLPSSPSSTWKKGIDSKVDEIAYRLYDELFEQTGEWPTKEVVGKKIMQTYSTSIRLSTLLRRFRGRNKPRIR